MKKLLCLLLSFLLILSSISMLSACSFGGGAQLDTDISDDNGDDTPDDGNGGNNTPDGGNGGSDTPSNPDDGGNTPSNPDGGNDTPSNPDDGGNGGNGGSDTPSNPDDGGANDNPSNEFIETVVDGVTYTPNQSETYTVSAVNLSSTTLTIPETVNGVAVTEIGKDAVRGKSTLLKVVLPDSVKTLAENSFMGCKKLKDINLSKVEVVGKNAFNGAITTTNTNLDLSSVKTMGDGAFNAASKLREVDMEKATLTEIPENAFVNCSLLYTVKLPETVLVVRKHAFENCQCLVNINLDKVENFKDNCFAGCVNLVTLTLTGAMEIREQAFSQCTKLASVTVGDNIEVLYLRAFYGNYALTYFKMGNLDEHWWWYHVSANAHTSDEINKDFWVTNDGASNETLKDTAECAAFLLRSRNVGVFICAESWVMARGYKDSQNFPHRTHMLED